MDTTTLITVITALVAGLFGKEAWSYYKKRLDVKVKMKTATNADEDKLRNEIKTMLESRISECKKELDQVISEVKELQEKRIVDQKKISEQETKIALLTERLGNYSFKSRGRKGKTNE